MSEAKGIVNENFSEFIKELNDFYKTKQTIYGTHTFFENGKWFGIIFYTGEKVNEEKFLPKTITDQTSQKSPPTTKQINFLKKHKVKIPKTKKEAFGLIKTYIDNLNEEQK